MTGDIGGQIVALLPRFRRFALGLTGSADAADDLVQAACERAIARRHQWEPETRLDSWIYRIIQTIHRDGWRAQVRQASHAEVAGAFSDTSCDGEREIHARLTLDAVRRAVAALPEEQRAVILLIGVEEQSYKQTAEILGVPIGTVTSRLTRGRMALVRMMAGGERDGEPGETALCRLTPRMAVAGRADEKGR